MNPAPSSLSFSIAFFYLFSIYLIFLVFLVYDTRPYFMVTKSFCKLSRSLCELFQSTITTNNNIKLRMRFWVKERHKLKLIDKLKLRLKIVANTLGMLNTSLWNWKYNWNAKLYYIRFTTTNATLIVFPPCFLFFL